MYSVTLPGVTGFGLLEALAEAAAKHLVRHHQLIAAHGGSGCVLLRIDIDQLDDPVAIGPGGGGEDMGHDIARHGDVFRQRFRFPRKHVGPQIDESLILDQPRSPSGTPPISRPHGRVTIRHGVCRIGDVGVEGLGARVRRLGESQLAVGV